MFFLGDFVFLDWYGWNSSNSCLISYFNVNGNGENRNVGFAFLPLRFWQHFHFSNDEFGHDNKRLDIGLGFVSFFVDYYEETEYET